MLVSCVKSCRARPALTRDNPQESSAVTTASDLTHVSGIAYSHTTRRLSSSIASDSGLTTATTLRPGALGVALPDAGRQVDMYLQAGLFCTGKKQCHQSPRSTCTDYNRLPWPGLFFVRHRVYAFTCCLSLCLSRQVVGLHVPPCGISEAKTPQDPLNARLPDICVGLCHTLVTQQYISVITDRDRMKDNTPW